MNMSNVDTWRIAIVGGGITGLTLALGLIRRGVSVCIYEQAQNFREIGAGIGFTPNAERAMELIDERIKVGFKRIATRNASDWFQYVDGYHEKGADPRTSEEKLLFRIYLGERGFEGCARSEFLDELVKLMDPGVVEFRKRLRSIHEMEGDGLRLEFEDGTMAEADAVIGCDGIRSRVRQLVVGEDNPASYPHYTHKYALRGLIPMTEAVAALGEAKCATRFMHLGYNAHLLTFPVALGSLMNVVAFVSDPQEWPHEQMTSVASKQEAVEAFKDFGPTVRAVVGLLPDELSRWAVFDTYDNPVPSYAHGSIALAGDAAHASAPHHGAGAGFGIEDALVLSTLLGTELLSTLSNDDQEVVKLSKRDRLRAAFEVYDTVRRDRAQWLVESSRIIGEVYEWQHPETGDDSEKCHHEAYWRSHRIWDYDVDDMVKKAEQMLLQRLRG